MPFQIRGFKKSRYFPPVFLYFLLIFLFLAGITARKLLSAPVSVPPPGMVKIPAGEFVMGSDEKDGTVGIEVGVDELPRHTVKLPEYYIDRYEVTNREYEGFVAATGHRVPAEPRFSKFYKWADGHPTPGQENYPVVYVDNSDAGAFCVWRGKRLPTEEEWEKAARGTDGRKWPWGDQYDPKKCNTEESRLNWTWPVGSHPEGGSPYGVMDMCGNVAEWTSSWYKPYPGSKLERPSFGETLKVVRGGAYLLPYMFSRVTHRTYASPPYKRHRSIGFRCALDAR